MNCVIILRSKKLLFVLDLNLRVRERVVGSKFVPNSQPSKEREEPNEELEIEEIGRRG